MTDPWIPAALSNGALVWNANTTVVTYNGVASLSATSTLSAAGVVTKAADSSLAATSTLTGTPSITTVANVALIQASTLTASADLTAVASVTLVAASTLSPSAVDTIPAVGMLSSSATLSTSAVITVLAAAALGSANLDEFPPEFPPDFGAPETATLTVSGEVSKVGADAMSATGTLSATASVTSVATVSLLAASTLTPAAVDIVNAATTLTAASMLVANAGTTLIADAALSSSSTLTTSAEVARAGTALLSTSSALTADALLAVPAAASLATTSTLTPDAALTINATSTLTEASSLSVNASVAVVASIPLTASSTLSATADVSVSASATLTSTAVLTPGATVTELASVSLSSTGTLTATGSIIILGSSTLSATSSFTATAALTRVAVATLASTASLTASGLVLGMVTGVTATITLTANVGTVNVDGSTGGGTDGTVGPGSGVVAVGDVAALTLTAVPGGYVTVLNTPPVTGVTATITLNAESDDETGSEVLNIDRSTDVITLTLDVADCPHQPGTLVGGVSNGEPSTTAYLFIDNSSTSFFSVDLDDAGNAALIYIPIASLVAGGHLMRVGSNDTTPESEGVPFTVGDELNSGGGISFTYPPDFITDGRWGLTAYSYYDIDNVPYYEFVINPDTVSYTFPDNVLTTKHTTAHNGMMLTWQGAPKPGTISFSGYMFTKSDVENLFSWVATNQRVWLKDDLLNLYLVKLENVTSSRRRDVERQWLHSYTITGAILYGQGV